MFKSQFQKHLQNPYYFTFSDTHTHIDFPSKWMLQMLMREDQETNTPMARDVRQVLLAPRPKAERLGIHPCREWNPEEILGQNHSNANIDICRYCMYVIVYIYIYTYTHMWRYVYLYICGCMYAYNYINIYVDVCIYIYIIICIYIYIYTYIYTVCLL